MLSRHARYASLILVAAVILGHAPPIAAEQAIPDEYAGLPPDLTAVHFAATGHNLTGGFLRFWWEQGQVALFGLPVTEEMAEGGRVVQYFERARFEYHPDRRGTPHEVQLGLLGREATPPADGPEQLVQVDKGVPIYVTYLTANVTDGQLAFADDVYGLDPAPASPAPVATASAAH